MTKKQISAYMAQIGRVGGSKSKRTLTTAQAKGMVRIRELKRSAKQPRKQKESNI